MAQDYVDLVDQDHRQPLRSAVSPPLRSKPLSLFSLGIRWEADKIIKPGHVA